MIPANLIIWTKTYSMYQEYDFEPKCALVEKTKKSLYESLPKEKLVFTPVKYLFILAPPTVQKYDIEKYPVIPGLQESKSRIVTNTKNEAT